jgi:hypothetical protein
MEKLASYDLLVKLDISSFCPDKNFLRCYNKSWDEMVNTTSFTTQTEVIEHAKKICCTYYYMINFSNNKLTNYISILKPIVNELRKNMLFVINENDILSNCETILYDGMKYFLLDNQEHHIRKKIISDSKKNLFSAIHNDVDGFIELFNFCDYQSYLISQYLN